MTKIAGSDSDSGSISQRNGSADPDSYPDPHVMDPEHWSEVWIRIRILLSPSKNKLASWRSGSGTLFSLTLRDVVGGGVHLDDLHVLVRHLGAQLVIDGGQLLAVPAPRRVELNQHVLGSRRNTTISVAGPGCLSRILICTHSGSRIQKQQQKRGVKKNLSKNYRIFYPKICHQALKNMGLGSGIKPIPDPGSGSRGQKGTGSRIRNTDYNP